MKRKTPTRSQSTQAKNRPSRHKKRVLLIQAVGIGTLCLVGWRILDIQTTLGPSLLKAAAKIQDVHKTILAPRGSILDDTGHPVAYDVPAYVMDIKVSNFRNREALAQNLSAAMKLPVSSIAGLVDENDKWIQWPRPVLATVKEALQKDYQNTPHINDFTFTTTEERVYPFGRFAAATIGYVGPNGQGVMGVESSYNKVLEGTPGILTYKQDASGFPLPGTMKTIQAAKPGDSVELTINPTIQGFVDEEMNKLDNQVHPAHAALIVMDPYNGAILAMSSRPNFNPNHYWTAPPAALDQNWAVSASFEPGSTFKLVVLSAALAVHAINLNQKYMSGQITIDGRTIHDWNYWGWGRITYRKALEYSSNVGFARIAMATGWHNLMHYLRLFGMTKPTGIDLPDEATSILFPKSDEHAKQGELELATTGFGQGIAVTPLQLVDSTSAIANGGTLYRPYVVKAILSPDGKVIQRIRPHIRRAHFISPSILKTIRQTMVLDVSQGIDNAAYIKGYDVAGKTGTAQVVNPKTGKFYSSRFLTSFIGFAPEWDPKVVVYCYVDWPKLPVNDTWGSTTATPIARAVLKDIMEYYHIAPHGSVAKKEEAALMKPPTPTSYVESLPSLVGDSLSTLDYWAKSTGANVIQNGTGQTVVRQWPAPGDSLSTNMPVYVWMSQPAKTVKMPNLKGLTMGQVLSLLEAYQLTPALHGSGFVATQSVPAGSVVHSGETVSVTLKPPLQEP
ncbi:MAG: penicillin-binding transpeptidase domain-containing protein [Alicyclobacillaceae bacterium]|nr:penicillin-binding transpeptidase domain-containing protein [Alicyclobacillaceae bacterium]